MAKRPEQVLPEERITAKSRLIEVCSQVAVEEQQEAGDRQAWHSEYQQERHHHNHPGEEWHAVDRQAWRAHAQYRHDEVDAAGNRRDAEQVKARDPEVHIQTRRETALQP